MAAGTTQIAYRNLSRQKGRSGMLIVAIAFGILVVTLLNSFTAGVVLNVQGTVSRMLGGHIYITGQEIGDGGRIISVIPGSNDLNRVLEGSGIHAEDISRRSLASATILFGNNTAKQRIEGVDWRAETSLKKSLTVVQGDLSKVENRSSLVITEQVAQRLKANAGDQVLVKLQTVTGQQNVGDFVVVAVISDPGVSSVLSAYADLGYLDSLLNLAPGDFQQLSIFLRRPSTMARDAARLSAALAASGPVYPREAGGAQAGLFGRKGSGVMSFVRAFSASTLSSGESAWTGVRYRVLTLDDLTSQVQNVVQVLDAVGFVVLVVLLLTVMVGITNTFRMIVIERTAEIGTMRALGMQRSEVRGVFLAEASLLAVASVLIGLAAALFVSTILHLFAFDPSSVFYVLTGRGHMTFAFKLGAIVFDAILVVALTLGAASFPARRAAGLMPAIALRESR